MNPSRTEKAATKPLANRVRKERTGAAPFLGAAPALIIAGQQNAEI